MIETGNGAAAYYADVMQAVVNLALAAPGGPPPNARQLPGPAGRRPGWSPPTATACTRRPWPGSAPRARTCGDIQLRYATLLDRLGPALDGPGTLADADAWYFILEGTREQSVAEAQAMALTELVAHAATDPDAEPRAILLAADDYSAVSGRVPLSNLYERGRSLGIGVQVSAQSWQGLGADEDERYRIAATADGGIWLLRTPYPEPLSQLAGTRRILEIAHKLIGGMWGDEGTTRDAARLDRRPRHRPPPGRRPGLVHPPRRVHLGPGRPPRPSPLPCCPPAPAASVIRARPPATEPAQAPAGRSPAGLDDVFGPEAAR